MLEELLKRRSYCRLTSSDELIEELQAVDKEALSATKKSNKVEILKTQVQIRKA